MHPRELRNTLLMIEEMHMCMHDWCCQPCHELVALPDCRLKLNVGLHGWSHQSASIYMYVLWLSCGICIPSWIKLLFVFGVELWIGLVPSAHISFMHTLVVKKISLSVYCLLYAVSTHTMHPRELYNNLHAADISSNCV